MIGQRFERLEVTAVSDRRPTDMPYRYYDCQCDCGRTAYHVRSDALRTGRTRSCGCLRREQNLGRLHHRRPNGTIMVRV